MHAGEWSPPLTSPQLQTRGPLWDSTPGDRLDLQGPADIPAAWVMTSLPNGGDGAAASLQGRGGVEGRREAAALRRTEAEARM